MYRRLPSDHDTPLNALELDFPPPHTILTVLDTATQVHLLRRRAQGLAAVYKSAMQDQTLEEQELQHALEVLDLYLEAADEALKPWAKVRPEELQRKEEGA